MFYLLPYSSCQAIDSILRYPLVPTVEFMNVNSILVSQSTDVREMGLNAARPQDILMRAHLTPSFELIILCLSYYSHSTYTINPQWSRQGLNRVLWELSIGLQGFSVNHKAR